MQNYVNYFSVNVFVLAGVFCQQIKKNPTILSEITQWNAKLPPDYFSQKNN